MKSGGRIIFNPIGTDLLISQDSIDKQQGYPVIKASQLVQKARHQLTAKEL
ncbi:replication protein, partial [Lacticaseibacillus paracasei]